MTSRPLFQSSSTTLPKSTPPDTRDTHYLHHPCFPLLDPLDFLILCFQSSPFPWHHVALAKACSYTPTCRHLASSSNTPAMPRTRPTSTRHLFPKSSGLAPPCIAT